MNNIYLLLILFILSCGSTQPNNPTELYRYPDNPTPIIWSQGDSQWIAHYPKLNHLYTLPDNPNVLISAEGDFRLVLVKLPDQSNLNELRDEVKSMVMCEDGLLKDVFINCQLGLSQSVQQFGKYSALSLTYYGNLQSPTSPNTLLFLQHDTGYLKIEIEGDLEPYLSDINMLIDGLSFKFEPLISYDSNLKGL